MDNSFNISTISLYPYTKLFLIYMECVHFRTTVRFHVYLGPVAASPQGAQEFHTSTPIPHHLCGRELCGAQDQQVSTRPITPSQARDPIPRLQLASFRLSSGRRALCFAPPTLRYQQIGMASGFLASQDRKTQNPEGRLGQDRSHGASHQGSHDSWR